MGVEGHSEPVLEQPRCDSGRVQPQRRRDRCEKQGTRKGKTKTNTKKGNGSIEGKGKPEEKGKPPPKVKCAPHLDGTGFTCGDVCPHFRPNLPDRGFCCGIEGHFYGPCCDKTQQETNGNGGHAALADIEEDASEGNARDPLARHQSSAASMSQAGVGGNSRDHDLPVYACITHTRTHLNT